MVPAFAEVYYVPDEAVTRSETLPWLFAYTPLHLAWAGSEAVLLFFVLSGIVLTLPALRSGFSWVGYYPRRVVRLYFPVAAAVGLTALLTFLVPRVSGPDFSRWVNRHPSGYTPERLTQDLTLLTGTSDVLSPLWSLQWEVMFSLLLPLYVGLALLARRRFAAVVPVGIVVGALLLGVLGRVEWVRYLGVFAIGSLLAVWWPTLARWASAPVRRWVARGVGGLVVVAGLYLTVRHWLHVDPVNPAPRHSLPDLWTIAGVTILVIAAGLVAPFRRVLETGIVQWLGRISFGLYLIHEVILLTTLSLFPSAPVWVVISVAVPLSLILAAVFTRHVEAPSHRLARAVGRGAQRLARAGGTGRHRIDRLVRRPRVSAS
jgi:peptidoglycan/LPS O-acetylase OafA/YrhL